MALVSPSEYLVRPLTAQIRACIVSVVVHNLLAIVLTTRCLSHPGTTAACHIPAGSNKLLRGLGVHPSQIANASLKAAHSSVGRAWAPSETQSSLYPVLGLADPTPLQRLQSPPAYRTQCSLCPTQMQPLLLLITLLHASTFNVISGQEYLQDQVMQGFLLETSNKEHNEQIFLISVQNDRYVSTLPGKFVAITILHINGIERL